MNEQTYREHLNDLQVEIEELRAKLKESQTGDTISRQAAIDALGERPLAWVESEYELGLQNQWESDVDAIRNLPSAQPAILSTPSYTISLGEPAEYVPIIRCKDCEWFGDIGCAIRIVDDSDKPTENDFCSFAERRIE